ncbi:hypothetical protein OPV22_012840 [Ensete ventricosum]|uniref:Uncharacterized protein n=2 Tax=Ensete ventricosum TaxID=4639 RepID=A0A444FY82_ENSVE|nr:hypothetical protein OPV22_012840 [Ensete ventricosum]RRT49871.1 hypothetical protein B296_00031542 [Ensete ventricosum]RWW27579.1 hypothetical protein GW17_00007984 [Ensete ventricosum]RWW58112.1 hypothetical protein BHE74_00035054 [Ensete ventricosum]RZS10086.1 hypothetical protein BHM03_00041247 [Ensete ventricosum]
MLQLLSAMRRRVRWPKKRSARVFDEAALALAPEVDAAAERRRPWGGGLAMLLALARAPLAAASCLACHADDMEARGQLHAVEFGDLVVGEAMRFAIYL